MSSQFSEYSAVVVNDEPLPRAHLVLQLREAGLTHILQASSGKECLDLLSSCDRLPNWAFLDIQMPDMDGLSLADDFRELFQNATPAITFVTGYEDYAVQAFDRAAVDYLLKPVSRQRLAVTLNRLALLGKASTITEQSISTPAQCDRLPIRLNYTVHLIEIDKIIAAYAHDKRVDIVTANSTYPTYYSLSELEKRLPETLFFRAHDSWIVNLGSITEIHNLGSQSYEIRLTGLERLVPVSRRRFPLLDRRLGL